MRRQTTRVVFTVVAVMTVALFVAGQSADPWAGTWKLNLTKSKYSPGPPPKSMTSKIGALEGGVKVTIDTVNAQGQPTPPLESIAKFDGKDYTVKGGPAAANTTRAYKKVDGHVEYVTKVDGKVTITTKWAVSRDGKTLTVTQAGKNAQGQTVNNTLVFDKQ